MERSNTNDYKQSVTAEANLRDMAELLAKQRQEKGQPLIHCGVYLDIAATDTEKLRTARDTVSAQLVRSAWAPIRCSCASGRDSSPPTPRAAANWQALRSGYYPRAALPICIP